MLRSASVRVRPGAAALAAVLALSAVGCAGDAEPVASAADAASLAEGAATTPTMSATPSAVPVASYPMTVKSCGRDLTVSQAPERVLLGFPTSIRTLAALGMAERALGYVTGSAAKPPTEFASLREVSPDYQPAREVVISARPDLFLANDENQVAGDNGVTVADLDGIGAGLYVLGDYCAAGSKTATVGTILDDVRTLGAVFGVPARAAELAADLQRRTDAAAALRGDRPALRAAFVQVYDGKMYALSGSYYAAILAGAGLANEFSDVSDAFVEISAEQVLIRRPDVLFVAYDGADPTAALADARGRLAASPAVKNDQVIAMSSAEISGGGVNIIDLIEAAARGAYGS